MNRRLLTAGLLLAMALPLLCIPEGEVHLTIIYDNYQADNRLDTDWGFACLVEFNGYKLLFDAGNKAELYRQNLKTLSINPAEIPGLFISHSHGDHTAGIPWLLKTNPDIKCYLPSFYAASLKTSGKLPDHTIAIKDPTHIYGPFYSTGDNFAAFREHGLVVKTDKGAVLITGCGHPGVVEMVRVAKEVSGTEIKAVIGGLHLMRKTDAGMETIASSLKRLGVKKICPTHCTGEKSISFLREAFGDGYIAGGTGQKIIIH